MLERIFLTQFTKNKARIEVGKMRKSDFLILSNISHDDDGNVMPYRTYIYLYYRVDIKRDSMGGSITKHLQLP